MTAKKIDELGIEKDLANAIQTCLALGVSRFSDICNSLCMWESTKTQVRHLFTRQAIPMLWDFAELNIFADAAGNYHVTLSTMIEVLNRLSLGYLSNYQAEQAAATSHPLPNDTAQLLCTDPPYYNAVPYADLSDFFYVWRKRNLKDLYPNLFAGELSPKDEELCEMAGWDSIRYPHKNEKWFEKQMGKAMSEGRRILAPNGIGIIVFAHKSTAGWESQLQAMINAGWIFTGSWTIDTELDNRLRAINSAALASSIHLVCRPRENPDGLKG